MDEKKERARASEVGSRSYLNNRENKERANGGVDGSGSQRRLGCEVCGEAAGCDFPVSVSAFLAPTPRRTSCLFPRFVFFTAPSRFPL